MVNSSSGFSVVNLVNIPTELYVGSEIRIRGVRMRNPFRTPLSEVIGTLSLPAALTM